MVDNFELIKSMFYFNEANNMFFHCQIVQRAKDHKGEWVTYKIDDTHFLCVPNYNADKGAVPVMLEEERK